MSTEKVVTHVFQGKDGVGTDVGGEASSLTRIEDEDGGLVGVDLLVATLVVGNDGRDEVDFTTLILK